MTVVKKFSLADVADIKETVTIQGQPVQVGGVTLLGLAGLIRDFPEVADMVDGKDSSITVDRIFEAGPGVVAILIADGCGETGNAAAIAGAAKLQVAEQLQVIAAMVKISLKDGIAPLVESLRTLTGAFVRAVDENTKAPDSK